MIDTTTNIVGNVIEWDGETLYTPPENCILLQSDVAAMGDTYNPDTQEFIRPVITIEEPPLLTPEQKLANAGLTVDELKTLLGL